MHFHFLADSWEDLTQAVSLAEHRDWKAALWLLSSFFFFYTSRGFNSHVSVFSSPEVHADEQGCTSIPDGRRSKCYGLHMVTKPVLSGYFSRSERCYECETPTAPECWRSSRSSLWQTLDCRYGDSRAQAWRTSVASCGMSSVRRFRELSDKKRNTLLMWLICLGISQFGTISSLVGPSVTVGRTARRTGASRLLVNQTNLQSPCRVNVHPVSKLLGPAVSSSSSCSGLSLYRKDDKGCRSIRLLSFSAINLGI